MSGKQCFSIICRADSLDGAVAGLSETELAAVAEYLSALEPSGGIPAQVFGMVSARLSGRKQRKEAKRS